MADKLSSKVQNNPFVVIIMNWTESGAHWIKGFATLEEAREAANEKVAGHNKIMNRILIIKGEVVQFGNDR